jgi:hypothetical protein
MDRNAAREKQRMSASCRRAKTFTITPKRHKDVDRDIEAFQITGMSISVSIDHYRVTGWETLNQKRRDSVPGAPSRSWQRLTETSAFALLQVKTIQKQHPESSFLLGSGTRTKGSYLSRGLIVIDKIVH